MYSATLFSHIERYKKHLATNYTEQWSGKTSPLTQGAIAAEFKNIEQTLRLIYSDATAQYMATEISRQAEQDVRKTHSVETMFTPVTKRFVELYAWETFQDDLEILWKDMRKNERFYSFVEKRDALVFQITETIRDAITLQLPGLVDWFDTSESRDRLTFGLMINCALNAIQYSLVAEKYFDLTAAVWEKDFPLAPPADYGEPLSNHDAQD